MYVLFLGSLFCSINQLYIFPPVLHSLDFDNSDFLVLKLRRLSTPTVFQKCVCYSNSFNFSHFGIILPILQKNHLNFFFFFWPCHVACRILVPQPGIEPGPYHWATRELPSAP